MTAAIRITVDIPRLTETIGTSTEPTTEKEPLIPQAHTKKYSFFNLDSVDIPMAKGNPIRNAIGKRRTRQKTIFAP